MTARPAAVAGTFYPADRESLETMVQALLAVSDPGSNAGLPKALIAPHAGFIYSGEVAASAYRMLEEAQGQITRVVLLGPAHRVYLRGMALPSVEAFDTPFGRIPLDHAGIDVALALPGTVISDEAHAQEHCLEVHLPFLSALLEEFSLIPIVVGECPPEEVARVLEALWGGPETLIVVSSDLSHYHAYETAREIDAATSSDILARATNLTGEQACGAHAINGLMVAARKFGLGVRALDVRNSGDTAGDRRQVVGYGAYALA
jgi:AmmeMemoRadiSam system protein B